MVHHCPTKIGHVFNYTMHINEWDALNHAKQQCHDIFLFYFLSVLGQQSLIFFSPNCCFCRHRMLISCLLYFHLSKCLSTVAMILFFTMIPLQINDVILNAYSGIITHLWNSKIVSPIIHFITYQDFKRCMCYASTMCILPDFVCQIYYFNFFFIVESGLMLLVVFTIRQRKSPNTKRVNLKVVFHL